MRGVSADLWRRRFSAVFEPSAILPANLRMILRATRLRMTAPTMMKAMRRGAPSSHIQSKLAVLSTVSFTASLICSAGGVVEVLIRAQS